MSLDQHAIHAFIRASHIAVGAGALLVFWIPIFAKKGGSLHIRSGRLFVWCAYLVSATAAISCTWALLNPLGFTGITRDLTDEEIRHLSKGVRFLFSILGTLMTWLVAGLQMGTHVVKHRSEPQNHAGFVRLIWKTSGIASAGLLLFGLANLRVDALQYLVPVTLGTVGILDTRKNLTYLRNGPPTPMGWWYMHMECMLGSGIAIYTAFFVFGFTRVFRLELHGPSALVPWLLPAAIGLPAIAIWTGRYKKEFGE